MTKIVTNYWKEQEEILENHFKNDDISKFLDWLVIRHNMVHEVHSNSLKELQESNHWHNIKKALKEDRYGNPKPYYLYPESSGNLIHHAYSFLQLLKNVNFNVASNVSSIYEFGGGYGSFCRLMYRLGFQGNYNLIDLPIFLKLQKIYLENIGLDLSSINFKEEQKEKQEVGLFVSLWAISETPVSLREEIFSKIEAYYYLIAYQKTFENVDNIEYFKKFKERNSNYKWTEYEMSNIKGSYYLIGEKNEGVD